MKCSCKELKKPEHPLNVDVAFPCRICDRLIVESVWFHSVNWRKNNPDICDRCKRVLNLFDRITQAMWLVVAHVLRRLG